MKSKELNQLLLTQIYNYICFIMKWFGF